MLRRTTLGGLVCLGRRHACSADVADILRRRAGQRLRKERDVRLLYRWVRSGGLRRGRASWGPVCFLHRHGKLAA